MEPTSTSSLTAVTTIIFFLRGDADADIDPSEMLAAVLLADHKNPWVGSLGLERLDVQGQRKSRPGACNTVHQLVIKNKGLTPDQIAAYTQYTARLAETAPQYMASRDALDWTAAQVEFTTDMVRFNQQVAATV